MNDLQIGKMYLVKKFFWLLFPTKKMARGMEGIEVGVAYQIAKGLSEYHHCNVCVVAENTCFVLLVQDEEYFKLLDSNGNIGWIWCNDFFNYFELVKE